MPVYFEDFIQLQAVPVIKTCGTRKYPYPIHGRSSEGGLKNSVTLYKGKWEVELEFFKGWGIQTKNPQWGEMDIF